MTTGEYRQPAGQWRGAAPSMDGGELPAPETITRIMLRPQGDFGHQIEHAEREPGVRRQL